MQSGSSCITGFFAFQGRLGRLEFLVRSLIVLLLILANFALVPQVMEADAPFLQFMPPGLVLIGLFSLLFLLARRLQDMSVSGWWALLFFVFVFTLPPVIVALYFVPGAKGDNRFGPGRDGTNDPTEKIGVEKPCKP